MTTEAMLPLSQVLAIIAGLTAKKPVIDVPAPLAQKPSNLIDGYGRKVIVRSRDAGVQYGELAGYEGSTVHLVNARQMWSWTATQGGTLLDCANHGVKGGKFSTVCPAVTVIGACAIIDVSAKAIPSLDDAKWA